MRGFHHHQYRGPHGGTGSKIGSVGFRVVFRAFGSREDLALGFRKTGRGVSATNPRLWAAWGFGRFGRPRRPRGCARRGAASPPHLALLLG